MARTMTIRWYRLAVFALWLASMSWLTVRKILPPFLRGEPPVYEASVSSATRPPVAWHLYWNKTRLGWALSEINQQGADTTVIHSLVHFDSVPLAELVPLYFQPLARAGVRAAARMEMEVESELITSSALNQLVSFYSKFRPKAGQNSLVKLEGVVEAEKLKLAVQAGDFHHDFELPLPDNKVRDNFSPEMELRGLRLGQSWTIVSYSPLTLPNPLEIIQGRAPTEVLFAKVEEQVPMKWNGKSELMWVVVYRSDPNEGPGSDKNLRNRLWIDGDGTVVRQEVFWDNNCLSFDRMSETDTASLRAAHPEFNKDQLPAQP
jgi:hypothetical protein